ncbi:unnamed protein product [Pieris macdunnoughi]|uniref:Uncharacterized protein n=1 Tax=Pieris macdunnoughi TaxID=345717 RepID=A0A821XFE8_9NEOP|nr:unnamed protein product [Pieris macdunnoughi]
MNHYYHITTNQYTTFGINFNSSMNEGLVALGLFGDCNDRDIRFESRSAGLCLCFEEHGGGQVLKLYMDVSICI